MDSMRLAASFPKPSSLTIGGSDWSSDRFKKNAAEKPPFFLPRWTIMCVVNTFIVVWVLVVGFGFGVWASINNFIKQVDTFGLFAKCYQCPPKAPVACRHKKSL